MYYHECTAKVRDNERCGQKVYPEPDFELKEVPDEGGKYVVPSKRFIPEKPCTTGTMMRPMKEKSIQLQENLCYFHEKMERGLLTV